MEIIISFPQPTFHVYVPAFTLLGVYILFAVSSLIDYLWLSPDRLKNSDIHWLDRSYLTEWWSTVGLIQGIAIIFGLLTVALTWNYMPENERIFNLFITPIKYEVICLIIATAYYLVVGTIKKIVY